MTIIFLHQRQRSPDTIVQESSWIESSNRQNTRRYKTSAKTNRV